MIHAIIDGAEVTISAELIEKYGRPGPRYTSYPTAPDWKKNFGPEDFSNKLKESNQSQRPLSLYFHIPFCEERCTFCACSVIATKKHEVTDSYLKALIKEMGHVANFLDKTRLVEQIHWGGGTPTYLSYEQIKILFDDIAENFTISDEAEISIEIDPRVTTDDQLKTLRRLGFNRVSLGVQDFEPEVQKETGRIQSQKETKHVVDLAREIKFESINIDLVYGLPKQTPQTFQQTIKKVLLLDPDRIALFNFAFVPWMYPHQRKILEKNLPNPITKLKMFCHAIEVFQKNGYEFIGLDHFAKKADELTKAKNNGTMYRNFQGYTTKANCDLIGMGVTSISSVDGCFAQNAKKLKEYEEAMAQGKLATRHGLKLNKDDLIRQGVIREIFCHQKVLGLDFTGYFATERERLKPLKQDGLIRLKEDSLEVTPLGRLFLRNIGIVFDAYLKPGEGKFSKTV